MVTVAPVDLRGWTKQGSSPILDGNYPLSVRPSGGSVRFFGYRYVSISSITINSIVTANTSTEAPMALLASAQDVAAVGSRLLTSSAIIPYEDLEFRWTLTKQGGGAVQDLEGILDPRDASAVNPYTDQISPEFTCVIREAGTYDLKLTARGMSSTDLTVIEKTFTKTITVVENTLSHLWYDGASGDDANDGLDPWGFALTTATYTESTGALTQVGAFTSYVQDTTSKFTNRDNYIYITLAGVTGLYRIASKTDNDTIILEQKLGSDQTNVTSSDGAKKVFNGTVITGTNHHLEGGSTYTIINKIQPENLANSAAVTGYGGSKPKIFTTTLSQLVRLNAGNSASLPPYFTLSDLNLDPEGNSVTIDGTISTTTDTDDTTTLLDDVNAINGSGSTGITYQSVPGINKDIYFLTYAGYVDNRYGTTGKGSSRFGLFTALRNDSWTRIFGTIIDNDADNSILDHFYYPNGNMDHFHAGYVHTRNGSGNNYGLNTNSTEASIANYLSVNNCLFGPNSKWGVDFSNANNEADTKAFQNIQVINNKANVSEGFTFHYAAYTSYIAYNQAWGGSSVMGMVELAKGSNFDANDFQGVIYANDVYGQHLVRMIWGATREIIDNVGYQTADDQVFRYNPSNLGAREFVAKDNNLYAPNASGGNIIDEDGSNITLAAFNTNVGDTNTSSDPSWTDPANGSFNGTPLGLAVTVA